MSRFSKILIANRGEIAVRVMQSAKKLGIQTVAVYSEVDENALHVQKADEAYCIGHRELSETYLNIEKIIDVALKSGCEAIHPGYGFLAENSLFVKACDQADLVFIGPNENAIRLMGNKIESREFVNKLDIPMTQGITGSPKELLKNANTIPFPILVKAAAGGGGKGMRIVSDPQELEGVLESTSREANNYFGDGTIYIEKYVEEPRHIEFQVLGDNYGNVVHLFERECTIQRRYQKIIEESPSPTLTPEVRQKMGEAAVQISKEVGYNSAGTVEFLVDKDLNFYFLEMNTRIQVEHPVTEMVTGIDLVEEQILVAAGDKLRLQQDELAQNGHAIECRIYAEDPANNFMPSPGMISYYKQPTGDGIRVDSSIERATEIHSFFDPMIGKLIVWAGDRETATDKSILALKEFVIHGIKTNIPYLLGILRHPAFKKNELSTKFCDEHTDDIINNISSAKVTLGNAFPLLSYVMHDMNIRRCCRSGNIWEKIGYWRINMEFQAEVDLEEYTISVEEIKNSDYKVSVDNVPYVIRLEDIEENEIKILVNERFIKAYVSTDDKARGWITIDGMIYHVSRNDILNETVEFLSQGQGDGTSKLFAPMPGKVIKINVKAGDKVKRGKVLLVVEAMKMENNIIAENDAIVEKIAVDEGDMVDTDVQLVYLETNE